MTFQIYYVTLWINSWAADWPTLSLRREHVLVRPRRGNI